jgi:hypothetical protein
MLRRRRKQKIEFYTEECRRGCGQLLTTSTRSILGMDDLKNKYHLICSKCLTEHEKHEMLNLMANKILRNA